MSETASLAVTPSAQKLRLLSLQSGSISLPTLPVSLLLFHQPCIKSCFEPSTGCEGNGKIPVRVCYLVAGYGKLSAKATAELICQWGAVVLQEDLILHRAHLHSLQTSQGISDPLNELLSEFDQANYFLLEPSSPLSWGEGGKSHRKKHSQPCPGPYPQHIFHAEKELTSMWSNDYLVTIQ